MPCKWLKNSHARTKLPLSSIQLPTFYPTPYFWPPNFCCLIFAAFFMPQKKLSVKFVQKNLLLNFYHLFRPGPGLLENLHLDNIHSRWTFLKIAYLFINQALKHFLRQIFNNTMCWSWYTLMSTMFTNPSFIVFHTIIFLIFFLDRHKCLESLHPWCHGPSF